VIDFAAERARDGEPVRVVAVRGDLRSVDETRSEVSHERCGLGEISRANPVRRYELRVGVDRNPRPDIARLVALLGRDVALLRVHERPKLVHFDVLAGQPAQRAILVDRAHGSEIQEKLDDGVLRHSGYPHRRAD
jgi:hypothetical protein